MSNPEIPYYRCPVCDMKHTTKGEQSACAKFHRSKAKENVSLETISHGSKEIVSPETISRPAKVNWNRARTLADNLRGNFTHALAHKALLGLELNRLRSVVGETRGRGAGESFEDQMKAQTGISRATAYRYMELANGAESHCKKLSALMAANAPASKILPVLEALTKDKPQADLMIEWGLKEAPEETPTKPLGGNTSGSVGRPSKSEETMAEESRQWWAEHCANLAVEIATASFERLRDGELSDALATVTQAKQLLETAIKNRRNATK